MTPHRGGVQLTPNWQRVISDLYDLAQACFQGWKPLVRIAWKSIKSCSLALTSWQFR